MRADPTILAELDEVRSQSDDGRLHPEAVVEFAKNPRTALHGRFTWDDTEAAQSYRIWEARQLIAVAVKVIVEDRPAYRVYVSLSSDRTKGGGYREVTAVLRNKALYAEMLEDALRDLRRLEEKYQGIKELGSVWQAAKQVRTRRKSVAA